MKKLRVVAWIAIAVYLIVKAVQTVNEIIL